MALLIVLLGLIIRLYRLGELPGEMWGDVNEHYRLAQRILDGNFFYYFDFGGDGPLISYLIAGIAKITGLSFYSIKLTTVIVDVISVFVIYHLAFEIFKKKSIAYLSSFLMAVSFWNISLSRQGKPYIIIPLFVMLSVFFLLKKRNLLAGFILALGMYTQAAFWGMLVFAFYNFFVFAGFLMTGSVLLYGSKFNFHSLFPDFSYIEEKMGLSLTFGSKLLNLANNLIKNVLSFNFKGDTVFRHNIPGNPNLDIITGFFFIIGFVFLIYKAYVKKDLNLVKYFFIPFLFAQLPSILDIRNSANVPSMGRMAGAAPFAYMGAAYAMVSLIKIKKGITKVLITLFLIIILGLNLRNYFIIYPKTLPGGNLPFTKIIASEMDKYDKYYLIGLVGCCWEEYGHPEPLSIDYTLVSKRSVQWFNLENYPELNCKYLNSKVVNKKMALFADPDNNESEKLIVGCVKNIRIRTINNNGINIVKIIEIEK